MIKASQNFSELGRDITKIEDEIANSRKYYNGSVRIFNTKIQVFPNNIIAKLFNFKEANMFEANADEKTREFFKTVQNKMHFAVHKNTILKLWVKI